LPQYLLVRKSSSELRDGEIWRLVVEEAQFLVGDNPGVYQPEIQLVR
jgi:hypothetical protein